MGRPVVGKKELLQWASATSAKACQRLEDLQDGSVLLRVFARIWPQAFKGKEERLKAHIWDVKRNWELLRSLFVELQLPLHVFDPSGIQRSSFKPCFAILVLCFFLQQLTENRSFSCDFAYPIDQQLADFLQSRASIASLSRHGSLKENALARGTLENGPTEGSEQDAVIVEVSRKAFTRQDSAPLRPNTGLLNGGGRGEPEVGVFSPEKRSRSMGGESEDGRLGLDPVEWRTAGERVRGELLLANLRFENDSLRRQMEASVQERHFLLTRYEQESKEAAAAHTAELHSQAEALRSEFAVERLKLGAERGRDQQRFVMELRKVADGLRAEAERSSAQGHAQPSVEETSKLRQQLLASACARAVQEDHVAAMERRCAVLEAEVIRQQEEVGRLHREVALACRAEIGCSEVLSEEASDAPVASTSREAALLRQLRKLARDATQADLARARVEEELNLKVWKLEQGARTADREEPTGETFGALLREFEEEHASERLRSEVKLLHADNAFLRERAAVFDRHNLRAPKSDLSEPATSDSATWLPREHVLRNNEEDERISVELSNLLKSFAHPRAVPDDRHRDAAATASPKGYFGVAQSDGPRTGSPETADLARLEAQSRVKRAVELFWRMVVAQTVLKQRVARSARDMRAMRQDARAAARENAEERRAAEEQIEALEGKHKEELLAIANGGRQELALLTVKKGLLENEVADLHREMDEAMLEIARARAAAQQQHEEKFHLLKKRLRESRAESSQLRLKEQHYARLASCHKEAAALCEHVAITAMTVAGAAFQPGLPPEQVVAVRCAPRGTMEEVRALIKKKGDLDAQAAACLDGIRAVEDLGGSQGTSDRDADGLDQVVGEATEVLRTEVGRLEKALEVSRQKAGSAAARATELEVAVRQREGQLTSETALRAHARKEAERLLAANAKLQKRLVEQREMVDQDVSRLHVQLTEAMMRLDEQSAILDASMRLGIMQIPPEPKTEPKPEPEADPKTKPAIETEIRSEAENVRAGSSVDRQWNPLERIGTESSGGNASLDTSGSVTRGLENRQEKPDRIQPRMGTSGVVKHGSEDTLAEIKRETRGAPSEAEGQKGVGVSESRKWGGELLEMVEETGWEERDRGTSMGLEMTDRYDAVECPDGDETSYGRFRVAALTPIPEHDGQDTPSASAPAATWHHAAAATWRDSAAEGFSEFGHTAHTGAGEAIATGLRAAGSATREVGRTEEPGGIGNESGEENATWHEERAERAPETERTEGEISGAHPGEDPDPTEIQFAFRSGSGSGSVSESGSSYSNGMERLPDAGSTGTQEPSLQENLQASLNLQDAESAVQKVEESRSGGENEAFDPIIEMFRRISQSSERRSSGYEMGAFETEGSGLESATEVADTSDLLIVLAELPVVPIVEKPMFEASPAAAEAPQWVELAAGESPQTTGDVVREPVDGERDEVEPVVGEHEWVEKKVVGVNTPGGSPLKDSSADTGGGSDQDGGTSNSEMEGRPAAFSMDSHAVPDFLVDWDFPENPGERLSPGLQSPVSPPPFALPEMA